MPKLIHSVLLTTEHDVVTARQRARDAALRLGFDGQDQTRIATAVSEIARNAINYAGKGKIDYAIQQKPEGACFVMEVSDNGPGISDLNRILEGRYESRTGMGLGIIGARRLMDDFEIRSSDSGTRVRLLKFIPARAGKLTDERLAKICEELSRLAPRDVFEELRQENRELLRAMDEVRGRQEELNRLNIELMETNRGVVALTKELEESAGALRLASETKSRFLSYMSHEFRTPLTSIIALSRLLLGQVDGPLTSEQQKQVGFIRTSAEGLLEIVGDLLDLAKVEAGRTDVRPVQFEISGLFGTLRGMMKPLQANEAVNLVFEDATELPHLYTDESKVAQILRNFISNALKFTTKGEVRVRARVVDSAREFGVADTGVGIPAAEQSRIFQEFTQIENPLQRGLKGTGLGLSLSRKLAELLGGSVGFESEVGKGSTFWLRLPLAPSTVASGEGKVLIVDDEEVSRYLIKQSLGLENERVAEARNGTAAMEFVRNERPLAIFLDLNMPDMDGAKVLDALKKDPSTQTIPVIVVTSRRMTPELSSTLRAASGILSKEVLTREDAAEVMRNTLAGVVQKRT